MSGLEQLFRWMHILAGVLWIGLLYFFNWVNSAVVPTLDAETKKKVLPELLPRTLYWFRWGAAWTWITGVVLLMLVFYKGGEFLEGQDKTWTLGAIVMVAFTFLAVFLYDALFKSPLGKTNKVGASIGQASKKFWKSQVVTDRMPDPRLIGLSTNDVATANDKF